MGHDAANSPLYAAGRRQARSVVPVYLVATEILQLVLNGVNFFDLVGTRAYLISQNIIFASQIFLVLGLSARFAASRLLKPKPARKKAQDTTLPRWLTAGRKIDTEQSVIYRALRAVSEGVKRMQRK